MKISELEIGQQCTIPLVVISAVSRETRAKKPYLAMEFYDGTDNISGNYWDWSGKNIPNKNAILDVAAQVTEWQGVKQLNIKNMSTNTEKHISEFMPSSGRDITTIYKDAYTLAADISDPFFNSLCLNILEELQPLWLSAPGAKVVHHAYTAGTLIHSLSVAKLAQAMSSLVPGANIDLATVGGLLHDVGKLFCYRVNGIVCEMTDEGMLFDHLFVGAEFVGNYADEHGLVNSPEDEAKLEMLRHIILSHHGKQEMGAVVEPSSIEAHIVFYADSLDAAAEQIRDASSKVNRAKMTERIWGLGNRPHLSTDYVQAVMEYHPAEEEDE